MNIYIIAGIVVIGLGTVLIYYGSSKNDTEATQEITSKIEATQQKIEELKTDPNLSQKEIQKVENEFLSWADEFLEKKQQKQLDLDKTILGEKETRIKLGSIWRPQIEAFLAETKNVLTAYNTKSGDTIKIGIPDLPKDIFQINATPYEALIHFREDVIWKIKISPAKEHTKNPMVDFYLYILKDTLESSKSSTELLAFVLKSDRVQIVTVQNTRFNLKTIPEVSEYSDYILKGLARILIENQLLQL